MNEGIPDDFRDLLVELVDAGARFLVVGGYAVAVHGHPRATKDIDVWVEPTATNAKRVYAALARFGAPVAQFDIAADDFEQYDGVLQLGVAPVRIDILTRIGGVAFAARGRTGPSSKSKDERCPSLVCGHSSRTSGLPAAPRTWRTSRRSNVSNEAGAVRSDGRPCLASRRAPSFERPLTANLTK